ncbi:MAG: MerR family transcriptional regulator [Deltaproteobacteria bacterium]|nr:MAG: MerR family transcriptional regulator [Deltaproteobacteria bacterium]
MLVQLNPPTAQRLRVGALAKRTGKTVRALHHYERLGLLTPTERSDGGYRLYDSEAEVRVRWIVKLQDMGFTLSQVQAIVRHYGESDSAPGAMAHIQELYNSKLTETREHIAKLTALEAELVTSLAYLATCDTCDPNRLVDDCPTCNVEHPQEETDLVAGLLSQSAG